MNKCNVCKNKRNILGDCHISCAKPDNQMTGNDHGIRSGWFNYPYNFDPRWATKECANFEELGHEL